MYDVKYAPFADSYIGMANGDTYEHLKRWLQQRLRFVDSLYDYAPSYNNDVLTIRANTTEPMTLEIETYTPVYQHLSWYNNQMDKKKIDGKTSVTFTGKAMAETDQEVLIYGGSNIKSIKGITSMNPNRMLIGSATRLIQLDAPNCPLLADINANKANLAPHVYLNKVNLSGCPLLGGNLIVNQSPLIREIDIRNTAITGLNLSSNLRNLEILRLPSGISSMVLNDASQLHTLEFDEGGILQNVSMTNCNALTNVTNFDLSNAQQVTLNNSYNTINELYLKNASTLSLSNMSNLEKVIYIPNAEHETFDITNLANTKDYNITTFNCPKLNTFMTTAPYRESYKKEYGEVKPNEVFEANSIDISNTQFTDVKLLCTTDTNVLKLPQTVKNLIIDSAYDLDTNYLTDGDYDVIHTELYEQYNTDYEGEVYKSVYEESTYLYDDPRLTHSTTSSFLSYTDYIPVNPNSFFKIYALKTLYGLNITQYDKDKVEIQTDRSPNMNNTEKSYSLTLSPTTYYVVCELPYNRPDSAQSGGHKVEYEKLLVPNLIPSASDGSLIFSMYAPSNTVAPASGVWDLKGLELENYHTFGLNNDVKLVDDILTMPDRYDEYSIQIKNTTIVNEIARYTASDWNTFPTFNSEFIYTYDITQLDDEVYYYSIMADSMDNLPTSISFNGKSNLLTVEYLNVDNVTNMYAMFQNCNNLTSLDLSNWDTSNATNMQSMFFNCNKLTSLNVSNFNTSNVTDMLNMFNSCKLLTSLDVSNFNTTNVTNMGGMFYSCNSLTSLDVSNFDTGKVTAMFQMFYGCNNLTSLDVSNFDTSKVTNMFQMFYGCNNLTSLDVSNWDTSEVINMESVFGNCTSLTSLNVSNFDTKNVTTMMYMFYNCYKLTSLDVSGFDTSNVTTMMYMFYNCSNLTSLDLSNWDTSEVTNMGYMFYGCTSLQELHIESWGLNDITQVGVSTLPIGDDVKNEIYAGVYFTVPSGWTLINALEMAIYTCNTSGVLPTFNDEYSGYSTQETESEGIYTVRIATNSLDNLPTRISFNGKSELLTVKYLNIDNVTNMSFMFYNCTNLTSLDVGGWDVGNVTNMSYIFDGCKKLTSLDVGGWDVRNVTDIHHMFADCNNLTSLDLSKWDTTELTDMGSMFRNCTKLTSLDLSNWDISKTASMDCMFDGCMSLTSLDVSKWDTTKVTYMGHTFRNCTKLTSLDLSNWDFSKVTSMQSMFQNCSSLQSLDSMQNIPVSLSLSSTKLDQTSLVDIINNLKTVTTTQTLTLGTTLLAKLTEEQIAVAVNKGWTVV